MSRTSNGLQACSLFEEQACIAYDDMSYKIRYPHRMLRFPLLSFFECTIANVLALDMIVIFELPRAWVSWRCPVVVVVQ